jgi:hypothetical protein
MAVASVSWPIGEYVAARVALPYLGARTVAGPAT